MRGGQVVAGPELGQPADRQDGDRVRGGVVARWRGLVPGRPQTPPSSSARARHLRPSRRRRSSAAAPPRTSTPGTSAVSPVCTSQPSSRPPSARRAVVPPDRLGAWSPPRSRRGTRRPCRAAAARRRSATARRPGAGVVAQRVAHAGHVQHRADAHHRVGRREQHGVGASRSRRARPGSTRRLLGADGGERGARAARPCAGSTTPGSGWPCAPFGRSAGSSTTTWVSTRSSVAGQQRARRAASGGTAPR